MKKNSWLGFPTSFADAEPPEDETIVKNIKKRTHIKWERKDERYIFSKKKFKIFVYKDGNRIKKAFLGMQPPDYFGWDESPNRISDSSWEYCEVGDKIGFRMLRMGAPFSNIFWQKREKKIKI